MCACALLLALCAPARARAADACPTGNLAERGAVSATATSGRAGHLVDGRSRVEGEVWNAPGTVRLLSPDSSIAVDLRSEHTIRGLVLQADANDFYAVDSSPDGSRWERAWLARPLAGDGLRTRSHTLGADETPVRARYLRVRVVSGDGSASVSELSAFCELPADWPRGVPTGSQPSPWLTQERVDALKLAIAVLASGCFGWGVALRRAGRPDADRPARDRCLAALGLIAAACWWNLFAFHFDGGIHAWEQFHYYMGSKYQRELGYTRLYDCAAVADFQDGAAPPVEQRALRDLATNRILPAAPVARAPAACTDHFEAQRWAQFKQDLGWFRARLGPGRWAQAQIDHGYNATPAWGILGTTISNLVPASDAGMRLIASLDFLLLIAMAAAAIWAFGWRAACVAAIWWGTNHPARFWWVGGAFLRQDWLFLSVLGICLVRRQRHAAGGAALAVAASLRIFPAFIVAGLALKWLASCVRARRIVLPVELRRFALGGTAALAAVFALSSAVAGGPSAWLDFARNSQLHLTTPLTNNVGLESVIAFEPSTRARLLRDPEAADPFGEWKQARLAAAERRGAVTWIALIGFCLLLARAVERSDDWVALVLGVGLIPFASNVACYYYGIFLAYGFLWVRAGDRVGLALSALSVVTYLNAYATDWYDELFTATSLAIVVFVTVLTAVWPRLDTQEDASSAAGAGGR